MGAALALSAPLVASAAEIATGESLELSLYQALDIAMRSNRKLIVARHAVASARHGVAGATATLWPQLELGTGLSSSRPFPAAGPSTHLGPSLALSYDLGTDGSRGANHNVAASRLAISELEEALQLLQIKQETVNAYYDSLAADEAVRIAQAAVKNAEIGEKAALALRQAGMGTDFDIQRARLQTAIANQELNSAIGDQHVFRRSLARVLGLPQGADVFASDRVEGAGSWTLTLDETIRKCLANRPDLRLSERQVQEAEAQRQLAESGRRPRSGVQLSVDYLAALQGPPGSPTILDAATAARGSGLGYSIVGSVQYPLFEGGAAAAAVRQSEIAIDSARVGLEDRALELRLRVERAYTLLEASRKNLETSKVALETATAGLASARLRFESGIGNQTEVIDAENDLKRSEGNRVRAVLDYNRALAALRFLVAER